MAGYRKGNGGLARDLMASNGLTVSEERVLKKLCLNGWQAARARYDEDGICIQTSRAAVEVLKEFGIEAQPLAVQVSVFTPKLAERVFGGTFDNKFREGEYSVGIGYGKRQDATRWAGHLALVVRDGLLDLTLPQADRHSKGLRVPIGGYFALPPDWKTTRQIPYVAFDNLVVVYELRHADKSFEHTPNWQNRENWQPAYNALHHIAWKK